MKSLILLTTFALTLTQAFAASNVPGGLPERLDCRLSSVSPKGHGSTFGKKVSIIYKEYDSTLPRIQLQPDFMIEGKELGLFFKGIDQEGVLLETYYKNPSIHVVNENGNHVLIVREGRGGGTGYGTAGFTVKSRYKCAQ